MKAAPPVASIKTDIFDFCQSYAGILKPFATSLEAVRATLQGKGDVEALQRPMAGFSDVQHRLESLLNKVEQQQAYLIIFGPLKSGKSTLMNAISAAYVSEVTSLPAYPCLVHVKHGDDCSFVVSRYSGEKLRLSDNAALQALIKQSHQTLAERLREVEDQGETFDPGVHYPDAIRRVDVTVPARNLKDSLTVLVDTPGLYTRMKFGYDLMTREFRNSAACAVFVVKTDNLFLEQVFVEFNDLLDLFSRIFIVVNIDTNKRDLDPDGSLRPSLESSSPGEVIRAFESLVMSAPLRRAQEAGRLKIYPIDLLNSASAAMLRANEPPHPEAAPAEAATDTAPADESAAYESAAAHDVAPAAAETPTETATETATESVSESPAAESAADPELTAPAAAETPAPAERETAAAVSPADLTPSTADSAKTVDAALPLAPQSPAELPPLPPLVAHPDDLAPQPATLPLAALPQVDGEMPAALENPAASVGEIIPSAGNGRTIVMPTGWNDNPDASFAVFLKDLTDYLNSSDYLQEFMGDALLMGTNLGAEIQEHCSPASTAALETRQQALVADLGDTEARLAAMGKLAALDTKVAFAHVRGELQKHVVDVSVAAAAEARQKALKLLEDWFDSDQSVAALQRNWAALLDACGKRVSSECHLKERALVSNPLGGIRIDDSLRSPALGLVELLGPVVAAARAAMGDTAPAIHAGMFQIEPEHLKVHKSLWDWLAFRSLAAVRRRLFGAPDALDREVSVLVKEKRLGGEGRQALEERILSELSRRFPSEALRVSDLQISRYIETYGRDLHATLQAGRDKDAARKASLQQRIEDNLAILRTLAEITGETTEVLVEIDALGRKYHSYSRVTAAAAELAAADEAAAEDAPAGDAPAEDSPVAAPATDMLDECGTCEEETESASIA